MTNGRVTARAGANIAFIKYWGNRPGGENLPLNPSLSMTLASCETTTTVERIPDAAEDEVMLNGRPASAPALERVVCFLDGIRRSAGVSDRVRMHSSNSFPIGCGIASSASGFAALALAAGKAYGLEADERELSRRARLGSGSAARSVMGGFVALRAGTKHEETFAEAVAPETHWPEIRDVIVVVSGEEKKTSSARGHRVAHTSEMLAGRVAAVPERFERVKRSILDRDLAALGEAAEADALSMHAVMMTSAPPLLYWSGRTVELIRCVWALRERGVQAYFTIDAGPNVHIITLESELSAVLGEVQGRRGYQTITDRAGAGVRIEEAAVS